MLTQVTKVVLRSMTLPSPLQQILIHSKGWVRSTGFWVFVDWLAGWLVLVSQIMKSGHDWLFVLSVGSGEGVVPEAWECLSPLIELRQHPHNDWRHSPSQAVWSQSIFSFQLLLQVSYLIPLLHVIGISPIANVRHLYSLGYAWELLINT